MTLIFQKQNRKSTGEKYVFFLNGKEVQNAEKYNIYRYNATFEIEIFQPQNNDQ